MRALRSRLVLASIPKGLPLEHVKRVLASCNRKSAIGRRDYAILLLLARLGLRAGEVVSLTLEDFDWETGRLTLRGKGDRYAELPVPTDVGKAIAAYLKNGRTRSTNRCVFLRAQAPAVSLKNSRSVGLIVAKALARAGINCRRKGAHQFRHALATEMLRQRCIVGRDWRTLAASTPANYRHLCQGRSCLATHTSPSMAGRYPMNTLQKALQEYLAMRRALGFQLLDAGPALSDFVSFLKRRRTSHITIRLALEWAQKPGAQPASWAHRLGFVRGFARYRSATDPRTEIPPWRLLPFRSKRARPYLYTDDEVRMLLKALWDCPRITHCGSGPITVCWVCWLFRVCA